MDFPVIDQKISYTEKVDSSFRHSGLFVRLLKTPLNLTNKSLTIKI